MNETINKVERGEEKKAQKNNNNKQSLSFSLLLSPPTMIVSVNS
jgi:hypothetical protein